MSYSKYVPGSSYASKQPRCGNAPVYNEVRGLTRSTLTAGPAESGRQYSGDSCSSNSDCGPIEVCVNGECSPVSITAPPQFSRLSFSQMSRSKKRRKRFARYR